MTRLAYLLIPLAIACGDDTSSVATVDAPLAIDAPKPDAAPSGPDGGPTATLTINNFDGWCDLKIEGAAYTAVTTYPIGTIVHLMGAPGTGFVWGYWSGTAGGTKDTSMNTTVTMSGDKTVLACCPFPPPASQTCP